MDVGATEILRPKKAKGGVKAPPKSPKPKKVAKPKKEAKAVATETPSEEASWIDNVPPVGEPIEKPAAAGDFDDLKDMTAPSEDQMKVITTNAQRWIENDQKIQGFQEILAELLAEQHHITTKVIPDAMAAVNLEKFKMATGHEIEVKPFLNGSLPKDAFGRKQALDWVIENEGGDLIKNKIVVEFGKGDDKQAKSVKQFLQKKGFAFDSKEDIHAQTYCAFIREAMAGGKKVPLEELNCYAGRAAKIKQGKSKIPKFGQ